jgi:hypothetical protein
MPYMYGKPKGIQTITSMYIIHKKLQFMKTMLGLWNKNVLGNIFIKKINKEKEMEELSHNTNKRLNRRNIRKRIKQYTCRSNKIQIRNLVE